MKTPPSYLKQRAGTWYVQMRVPAPAQWRHGPTRNESLRTTDEARANRLRHAVIARMQAEHEAASKESPATGAAALIELAEQTRAGLVRPLDFEAQADNYLAAHPVDEDGEPIIPASEVALIRRANAIASGSMELLDATAARWLELEATKGIKRATIAERRAHLDRLLTFAGVDAQVSNVTRSLAVGYVERVLNPLPLSLPRKQFMLATARRFADWLEVRELIPAGNPFDKVGMLLRAETSDRAGRAVWEPSHLSKFLRALPEGDPLFPVAACCAYLGCRPQELCNVRCVDVTDSTLTITKSKTTAGERTLPLPATLVPLVKALVTSSRDGYLIPGLTATGPDGDRYKLLGKRSQTIRNRLHMGKSHPLYSLRHTVVTLMTEARVPKELRQRIVGHIGADSAVIDRHYDLSTMLPAMVEALAHVTYGAEVDSYVTTTGASFRSPERYRK